MNVEFITVRCLKGGKSKVLLNWLFDFLLNYKMTHTSNTMVRDALWILISSLSLWVKLYPCKSLLEKLQWLWRISYLHYTDMVWQRNVSGQFSCVKPYLLKCQVPMWCPQNRIGVIWGRKGKKYCGVSMVFLLRFGAIQKWLLNPSLIPEFELNLTNRV